MNYPQFKLLSLAVMWNESASGRREAFHRAFMPDLEVLNRFQKDSPECCPLFLIVLLEAKVLDSIRRSRLENSIGRERVPDRGREGAGG